VSPIRPQRLQDRRVSWQRLLAGGFVAAAVAGIAGGASEIRRFGTTPESGAARVEAYVRRDFDRMTGLLSEVAEAVAADPAAARGVAGGSEGARALFDLIARVTERAAADSEDVAVTIYEGANALAWIGRPSDIPPPDRTAAYFITQSPLGLRLIHVRAIEGAEARRFGTVAAEHALSLAPAAAILPVGYEMATPFGTASLRMRWEGAGDRPRVNAFVLRAPDGAALVEASIAPEELARARATWRRRTVALVLAICAFTILLVIGPLLDRRAAMRDTRRFVRTTAAAVLLLLAGIGVVWLAMAGGLGARPGAPATLLLGGTGAAALVALLAGPVTRLRLALRARRAAPAEAPVRFALTELAAGALVAALIVLFTTILGRAVDPASFDLRRFSLHPWSGTRVVLLVGILAVHVAVLWAAALTLTAALAPWRVSLRAARTRVLLMLLWLAPVVAVALVAGASGWPVAALGLLLSAAVAGVAALNASRVVITYRRTTVAARIFALFVAFLLPALLLYPFVNFFADRATERLIAEQYAVDALTHPQTLQDRLAQAQREIDALPILADLVLGVPAVNLAASPGTERSAFFVWSQTVLARERLTSAVELYDRSGALASRFALNVPEYTGTAQTPRAASACDWDVFGEAAPFGSEERRMLHAERAICARIGPDGEPQPIGTIMIHVVFDYRTLPFITSQRPYFEVFRPGESRAPGEGTPGGEVDIVIYGWGLRALYSSARTAWPITEELFARLYGSREPFWTEVPRGGGRDRVFFSNDRNGIYALGYPLLTPFHHFVHLAELTTVAGAGFVAVLLATAVFTRLARERPRIGRALLREIRASFYRKLFLAFVLASVIPVLTLAFVIRAYFANLLRADVEAEAARTAAVAQRVIQESDALLRRSANAQAQISDDVMVWISQVIDQDVNIFDGAKLEATSERYLFASGLLPTRTPDAVYRAVMLEGLPSFVSQDQIGLVPYMIAATPVRAGARDMILTVPLAPRQREVDREIDDLDRGVLLASLFFILLGAAIGLSMAERIADPVKRLTRATRRIARGDFDARIAVRSTDELRRLVDAFNSMADELKAQRGQLERTHRLEAWAEMARQVAHEIKNPLTPIQLSAEHLRRVHADGGAPMGPVLESCVDAILGQVRLLRQISAEFSSFASSPTARPAVFDVPDLVAEVVDPYRTGLAGRIDLINRVAGPLPRVYVDRTLIARALANVVENALHAMPGRGVITLDAAAEEGCVRLDVRDTGVGMDEEALERIFEPYFSTKTTGTGLGLPIARRNVELSGGTIAVASARGQGTTVTLRLPVASSAVSSSPSPP
jgi:signal transduction histidine kinase